MSFFGSNAAFGVNACNLSEWSPWYSNGYSARPLGDLFVMTIKEKVVFGAGETCMGRIKGDKSWSFQTAPMEFYAPQKAYPKLP